MKFSRVVLSSLLLGSTSFALPADFTNEVFAVVSWSCLLRIAEPLTRAKARNAEMLLVRQDRPDRLDKRQRVGLPRPASDTLSLAKRAEDSAVVS
jgi:hypothetical protein